MNVEIVIGSLGLILAITGIFLIVFVPISLLFWLTNRLHARRGWYDECRRSRQTALDNGFTEEQLGRLERPGWFRDGGETQNSEKARKPQNMPRYGL